jgi:hypothetical protein
VVAARHGRQGARTDGRSDIDNSGVLLIAMMSAKGHGASLPNGRNILESARHLSSGRNARPWAGQGRRDDEAVNACE